MKDKLRIDVLAKVRLYRSDEGGRRGPTRSDFWRCAADFDGELFDCQLNLYEKGSMAPGSEAVLPVTFLWIDLVKGKLVPGRRFRLWEGGHKGEAEILEVM